MKIEKGQKYLCVSEVFAGNKLAFKKGEIYVGAYYDVLYDSTSEYYPIFKERENAFVPLSSAKWAIKRTPENAEAVNRWANETHNGSSIKKYESEYGFIHSNPVDLGSLFKTRIADGYTEIDFETFKEITGMGEEKREFIEDDWVIGWHCECDYKTKAWQVGQTDVDYAWVKGQTHHTWYENLRHATPEEIAAATQQKIFTIEDVRNGKCAIENDGTVEELATVINKSFPSQTKFKIGFHYDKDKYYGILYHEAEWTCGSETRIPSQSVKLFLSQIEGDLPKDYNRTVENLIDANSVTNTQDSKLGEEWQPKWGEEVEVSDDGKDWILGRFVGLSPSNNRPVVEYDLNESFSCTNSFEYIRQPIHEFTTEQAKQDLAKLHNINVNQIKITE